MKYKLLILAAVIFTAAGCEKLNQLFTFNINTQANIEVPASTIINTPFNIATPAINTNSTQEFQKNQTSANLIKEVVLDEMKLTISSPQGKTFSFMKSIHIYISTDDNAEVELAYLDNIPQNADSLIMVTTKENLDKIIKASSFKLRTSIETRETISESTNIQMNMRFKVSASVL